nr:MAG TPA: hypothetical protein [Caudoviricetes sp.]
MVVLGYAVRLCAVLCVRLLLWCVVVKLYKLFCYGATLVQ